jgi:hypothetical protein
MIEVLPSHNDNNKTFFSSSLLAALKNLTKTKKFVKRALIITNDLAHLPKKKNTYLLLGIFKT